MNSRNIINGILYIIGIKVNTLAVSNLYTKIYIFLLDRVFINIKKKAYAYYGDQEFSQNAKEQIVKNLAKQDVTYIHCAVPFIDK